MPNVTVIGPNGINDCSFHVHAAGCADVERNPAYRVALMERPWDFNPASEQELYEELFGDFMEESGQDWEHYRHDARVFPCVKF